MSSSSDRRRQKAGTGGPSNKGDRKSRLFDDATVAHQREVTRSFTSGRTEVWSDRKESAEVFSLEDCGDSEGVVPGVEERDDSSLAALGGLETETESSMFPSSVIIRESLVELVHSFHLPRGHKVLIPRVTNSLTHPPQGYMAISSYHLFAGLSFPFLRFLIKVLNLLELAPMQLTPNAYTRMLSLYLIFIKKMIGSPTDNILRHCFQMKKCPKKSLGTARPDGIYYLPARPGDYQALLQSNIKSNVREYKVVYFYIKGSGIESVEHKRFVLSPREFLVPWHFVWYDLP
ncbi:hypothetical protein ACOSQ4_014625 [Xanthoceras sorbifolium]